VSALGYRWLSLELGAPANDKDPALLRVNGRPVSAGEFRRVLLNVGVAVDALDQSGSLEPVPS
jgi:hypothetical protein